MQCSRCQFENTPGQTRCFKCGSILAGSGGAMAIEPPRMAGWRRPVRSLSRSLRGLRPAPRPSDLAAKPSERGESFRAVQCLASLVLGLVPGLPYLLAGRFGEILRLWLAWLALVCVGAFLYGLSEGYVVLGLAIAIHAWVMFRHSALELLEGLGERAVVLLVLVLVLFAATLWLPRLVIPGLACVRSIVAIPHYRIERGDYLLVRRAPSELKRGMIVAPRARVYGVPRGGAGQWWRGGVRTLGQIVGLPGEVVSVGKDGFAVNGRGLDPRQYPVPDWLRGREVTVRVTGTEQYFVSFSYHVWGQRGALTEGLISQACLANRDWIEARAFMLWWPLSRRSELRVD